jgi:hypothetical protein
VTRARADTGERGQTLPDFVVGVAIFLVTVTLVVQFVPQLLVPYEDQERPVVARRVASDLAGDLLATSQRAQLNETCTLSFFAQSGAGGCPFDTSEAVTTQVGVASGYSVNATLRDAPSDDPDSDVLCDVGGSVGGCASGGSPLELGPPVPQGGESVATARRRVVVGDTEAVVEVGVW